jgi:hyperosmotically inducible periplasmic protein
MRTIAFMTLVAMIALWCQPAAAKDPVSDDKIHDNVIRKLAGDSVVKGGGLVVEVTNGVVTLTGKVKTEKQKNRAATLARKVKGVTQVVNQIVLQE